MEILLGIWTFIWVTYLIGYILNLVMDYNLEDEITALDFLKALGSWVLLVARGFDWLCYNWDTIENRLKYTTVFEKKEKK